MKRGIGKIIAGVVLFVLGLIVLPVVGVLFAVLGQPVANSFRVPGSFETTIEKPGAYTLWHDYRTVFEGRTYNRSEAVPDGLTIRVVDVATGQNLEFVSGGGMTQSSGNGSSVSIGHVNVTNPGKVRVEVTGDAEEAVFSFSRFSLGRILGWILGTLGVAFVFTLTGVGFVIWGIVQLVRSGRSATAGS